MSDAMKRRMESEGGNHELHINEGLEALDSAHHLPYETKLKAAKALLLAKHFGVKGIPIPEHLMEVNADEDQNGTR